MECPKCRQNNLPGSTFCEKCGLNLKALARQAASRPPSHSYPGAVPQPAPAPMPAPAPRPMPASGPPPRPTPPPPAPAPPPPRPSRPAPAPAPPPPPPPPRAPAPPPAYARLQSIVGGQTFELRYDLSKVGRTSDGVAPELDLSALDTAGMVSRRHAVITRDGEDVHVEDVGSSNGTSVNQVRLITGLQHPLKDQDLVRFGNLEFRYLKEART